MLNSINRLPESLLCTLGALGWLALASHSPLALGWAKRLKEHLLNSPIAPKPELHFAECTHLAPANGRPRRMAYWQWGDPHAQRVVLCVHGLSRQGRDFDVLAQALCARSPQTLRVVCPDVAGRGHSDWLGRPNGLPVAHLCGRHVGLGGAFAGPSARGASGLGGHQHGRVSSACCWLGKPPCSKPAPPGCRSPVWCSMTWGRWWPGVSSSGCALISGRPANSTACKPVPTTCAASPLVLARTPMPNGWPSARPCSSPCPRAAGRCITTPRWPSQCMP
jgi:hypothetical protein